MQISRKSPSGLEESGVEKIAPSLVSSSLVSDIPTLHQPRRRFSSSAFVSVF